MSNSVASSVVSNPGKYSVPPEIRALKPKDVSCLVKKIDGGFYVYEHLRIDDPKRPGKKKNATGAYLGKIVDGKYIPHKQEQKSIIDSDDYDNLDYGAYAIALSCSKSVFDRISNVFTNVKDATLIYVVSIIYFVNHYVPARDLREIFIQSFLCKKYSIATLSENKVGEFLEKLGRHSKKRLQFEQSLIDNGSNTYNIDGHVILCCSRNNELADYGSKYEELGDTQANFMFVFDAKNKRPVASHAFDGGIPDKLAVKDTLKAHKFENARFRMDSGFYAEDNFELYRENNCTFIIPIPGTTNLKKSVMKRLSFESSFIHERTNSHNCKEYSSIQYQVFTVQQVSDMVWEDTKDRSRQINEERLANLKEGEKLKKHYPKREEYSFPNDRIIVYKDSLMYEKLVYDYKKCIGDGRHTEEDLARLEPGFGIILLRTNDLISTPKDIYVEYKGRWSVETFYDYVENGVSFKALHEENYYVQQAIAFLMIIEGCIYSEVQHMVEEATASYVHNMSIDECIRIAGRLKLSQHCDNTWHANTMKGKINDMFMYFGVQVQEDIKFLDTFCRGSE